MAEIRTGTHDRRGDDLSRNRATGAFERRVARALADFVDAEGRVVVACSGGPDSTAALVATARALGCQRVVAAHFDHRLRPAAEGRAEYALVGALADRLGVEFVAGRAARAPGDRGEEAAREARYGWLARACVQADAPRCVTGHTLDDQAETVLLRLVRGAGAGGAAGMALAALWPVEAPGSRRLTVLRPLLGTTRAEVERYVAELGVEVAHDPSNAAAEFARNRVRRAVMPELRALSPRAAEQIAQFAERQRADDEALNAWASREFARLAAPLEAARGTGAVALDRRGLRALPVAVGSRCLRQAAERVRLALDGAQVEALLRACRRRGQHVALSGGDGWTDERRLVLERRV